jgi:hypothetical protein
MDRYLHFSPGRPQSETVGAPSLPRAWRVLAFGSALLVSWVQAAAGQAAPPRFYSTGGAVKVALAQVPAETFKQGRLLVKSFPTRDGIRVIASSRRRLEDAKAKTHLVTLDVRQVEWADKWEREGVPTTTIGRNRAAILAALWDYVGELPWDCFSVEVKHVRDPLGTGYLVNVRSYPAAVGASWAFLVSDDFRRSEGTGGR